MKKVFFKLVVGFTGVGLSLLGFSLFLYFLFIPELSPGKLLVSMLLFLYGSLTIIMRKKIVDNWMKR